MIQIRNIPRVIRGRVRGVVRRLRGYPFIRNVNGVSNEESWKRALLVYLVDSFLIREESPEYLQHQHFRQCKQIATALGSAGYCVDVADVSDRNLNLTKDYDLVLSHDVNLRLDGKRFAGATKVYLATGMHHRLHNENVARRYSALIARKGCHVNPFPPNNEVMPFLRTVDAIAGFGNALTAGSWIEIAQVPIFPFNNYGYSGTLFPTPQKDFTGARSHFLFFASRDQVAKGLDILLDIFPKYPALHLHVCSAFMHEPSFRRCYQQELFSTPNIHPIGLLDTGRKTFYDLIMRCGFVILPSCAEGQPGSVVQCMHGGLIPLVTRECGIDLGEAGVIFSNDSLPMIEESIVAASQRPPAWIERESQRVRSLAVKQFSEQAFVERWRYIAGALGKIRTRERTI